MPDSFQLRIGNTTADFKQPIDMNELQTYKITVDPSKEIQVKIAIGKQEIPLSRVYRDEQQPPYEFKGDCKLDRIGTQILILDVDGSKFKQKLRIKPTKISQEEYERILSRIRLSAYNIVFEIFGKSQEEIRLQRLSSPKSPIEFFEFFERNFGYFKSVFRRIEKAPNVTIHKRMKRVRFFEASDFVEVIEYIKPERKICDLQDKLRGLLPEIVEVSESFLSFDVYENRLLKHYLGSATNKLSFLQEIASSEEERERRNRELYGGEAKSDAVFDRKIEKWQKIISKCKQCQRDISRMRTHTFLQDVSKLGLVKTSMVLQKEPRYKAFYKLFREFQRNSIAEVHSDYFHLPMIDIWRIYEAWVLLEVYDALTKSGFRLKKQKLVDLDTRYVYDARKVRFNFTLAKNEPLLELKRENKTARLYYQRRYETSFTYYGSVDENAQVPDIAIEIFEDGNPIPEIVILDPKYRIDGDRPPESSKKDLSHYKNTIRESVMDKKIVKKAYVVYPGQHTQSFGRNKDYGYLGLTPTDQSIHQFKQQIAEMIQ